MMRDCKLHLVHMGKRQYAIIRKIPPLHATRSNLDIANQRQMYRNQNSMFSHSATFQRRPLNLVATRGRVNSTGQGRGRYNPIGMFPVQTRSRQRQTHQAKVMFSSVTNVLNPVISDNACEVTSPEVADVLASLKGKPDKNKIQHPEVADIVSKLLSKHRNKSPPVVDICDETDTDVNPVITPAPECAGTCTGTTQDKGSSTTQEELPDKTTPSSKLG